MNASDPSLHWLTQLLPERPPRQPGLGRAAARVGILLALLLPAAGHAADGTLALEASTLEAVATFTAAGDHQPLVAVSAALRALTPDQRPGAEQALLALADRPDLTPEARLALIDWLGQIGSPASVALLAAWAQQPDTADPALRSLALIPGPESDRALLDLLTEVPAAQRISVIDALGQRRVTAAVSALRLQLTAEDAGLVAATLDALSRIASPEALDALRHAAPPASLAPAHTWALLHAGRVLERDGDPPAALNLITDLAARSDLPSPHQVAVAEAWLRLEPERAIPATRPLLRREFVGPRLVRPWLVAVLPSRLAAAELETLTAEVATLPPAVQRAVLAHARQLAAPALRPVVLELLERGDATLRPDAFGALAACGDLATAELLVAALASPSDRTAAAAALEQQRTPGLDERLRAAVPGSAREVHAALLTILGRRLDRAAMPLLLAAAGGEERAPRAAAFRGLAALVTGDDLPTVLALRPHLQPADRRLWQDALRAAVRGRNDVADTIALLRREIDAAAAAERAAFLHALAGLDDPAAIDAIRELAAHPELERRKEMIRALSSVRNDHSFAVLIEIAERGADAGERLLALRGFLDTLALRQNRWSETIAAYGRAYRAAERDDERAAVLAALEAYPGSQTDRLVAELTATPAS